jgi:hypothetical protein
MPLLASSAIKKIKNLRQIAAHAAFPSSVALDQVPAALLLDATGCRREQGDAGQAEAHGWI